MATKAERGLRLRHGQWYLVARVGGRLHEKASGTSSRVEARLQRAEWIRELRATPAQVATRERPTFAEFAALYVEAVAKLHKGWLGSERYKVAGLVTRWGPRRLDSLRAVDLDLLRSEILASGKSVATANRYLSLVQAMARYAGKRGYLSRELAGQLCEVEHGREENERLRRLTPAEIRRLLRHCAPWLQQVVQVALNTGLRQSELAGLRWDYFDLESGLLRLPTSKGGVPRTLPLNEAARDTLRSIPRAINGYVWPGRYGRGHRGDLSKAFTVAARAAGLEDCRLHDLRHTFGSELAMAGATERDLQELLGHATTRMVRRYTHLSREHLAACVDRLAKSWRKVGEEEKSPACEGRG